jgi:hypothetical protein
VRNVASYIDDHRAHPGSEGQVDCENSLQQLSFKTSPLQRKNLQAVYISVKLLRLSTLIREFRGKTEDCWIDIDWTVVRN